MRKVNLCILIVLAVVVCTPIVFLISGSFMNAGELTNYLSPILRGSEGFASFPLLPKSPTIQSYVEILLDSPEFFVMFWNSIKMTLLILLGQLLIAVPAAWGFARFQFPGRNALFTIYILLMMMPFQVTMLSSYLVLDTFSLLDTHAGIILPAVFSTFPVFILYRFFHQLPEGMIEAAKLDGAGAMTIFAQLGLPLGAGGIISILVLNFLEYWNLLEQPMTFLKTKSLWPLSLYLPNIGLEDAGIALAASVVMLIPSLFVFLSGQDYLEQGIVASAMKE